MRIALLHALALCAFAGRLQAEEKKPEPPRVIAVAPIAATAGSTVTMRLRGAKLDKATELKFTGSPLAAEIKSKAAVAVPNGADAKDVGDTQLEAQVILPAETKPGAMKFTVTTPEGTTEERELRILDAATLVQEKEPNGGFREAQEIAPGKLVLGALQEDKDVDVFRIAGRAGQQLTAEITAARAASLLDSTLSLFDAGGRQLATGDDTDTRDSRLAATLPADGTYFLTVQDAHDRGGPWHGYQLSVSTDSPVSFHREVLPILRRNCFACHKPGKTKGGLDLTSFAALMKGGKDGASLKPGDPQASRIVEDITGDEPEMPKEGEPLTPAETGTIARWIAQGAQDDTPAGGITHQLAAPPIYTALPAVAAMAWSPDGALFAVAGYHEVVLHSGDGAQVAARLVGQSPRVESLAFSPDGKLLAVAGGAPSEYGEIQLWDVAARTLTRSIRATADTLYGVSFSPDAQQVAVGCADKTVRVFAVADGRETMKCDNHIDWVFATAFSQDGKRLVSASRDRAVKLIDIATGHLIDDVNIAREPVFALARHPREDIIVAGCESGAVRVYKIAPRGGRLAEGDNKEESYVRDLERLPGDITAAAYSADGAAIAVTSVRGEARIFNSTDGKRLTTLKPEAGPLFTLAFHPDGQRLAVAGADGKVRVFEVAKGGLVQTFDSVPLTPALTGK